MFLSKKTLLLALAIALPLAAGVLYKWNIMLSPAAGAVLMSLSTVIVAINAKMLRVRSVSIKKN